MKGGPDADKDGGEAALQNRPGSTAVDQRLVSNVDIRNAREIYNERSEGKHSIKRMVASCPRTKALQKTLNLKPIQKLSVAEFNSRFCRLTLSSTHLPYPLRAHCGCTLHQSCSMAGDSL